MSALWKAIQESAETLECGQPATFLDIDAIMHLWHLFLDTLQSAICYFSVNPSPMYALGRVLGSLFEEFCVWDEMSHKTTADNEALLAVCKQCLSISVVEVMPCLANILSPELLDTKRIQSLPWRRIGIILFSFLEGNSLQWQHLHCACLRRHRKLGLGCCQPYNRAEKKFGQTDSWMNKENTNWWSHRLLGC